MKIKKQRILIGLMLIFVLIFSTTSTVFAAKPVPEINVAITDITSSNVTLSYEWENIGAVRATATAYDFSTASQFDGLGLLGMGDINLTKRTSTMPLSYKTLSFEYAQYLDDPNISGTYCLVWVNLYDRKDNIIAQGFSEYVMIP